MIGIVAKILFLVLILANNSYGQEAISIKEIEESKTSIINKYLQTAVGDHSISDIVDGKVAFQQNHRTFISFERLSKNHLIEKPIIWFKFRVDNEFQSAKKIYMSTIKFSFLQYSLYQGNEEIYRGSMFKGKMPEFLTIELEPGVNEFYFRIQPHFSMFMNMYLFSNELDAYRTAQKTDIRLIVIFTVVVLSIFLNLLFVPVFKESFYFHYLFYLISCALWIFTIWQHHTTPWGDFAGFTAFNSLMAVFITAFSIGFLGFDKYPKIYRINQVFLTFAIGVTIFSLIDEERAFLALNYVTMIGSPFLFFCAIYIAFKTRAAHAVIYVVAFGSMFFGSP